MGRSTKPGVPTPTPRGSTSKQHTRLKKRCCKCRKKAMDIIEGKPLCRIHSPIRQGYIGDNE